MVLRRKCPGLKPVTEAAGCMIVNNVLISFEMHFVKQQTQSVIKFLTKCISSKTVTFEVAEMSRQKMGMINR